jgi:hypothetical protein
MPENGHRRGGSSREQQLQHLVDSQPGGTISKMQQRAANFDLQSMSALPAWRSVVRVNVFPQEPFFKSPVEL